MPRIQTRKCSDCDKQYDLLWTRTRDGVEEASALDRADIDDLTCPACASTEFTIVIGVATGIDLGGDGGAGKLYPYYDRALQVRFESAQHRRRYLKQHNIVALEGGFEPEKLFSDMRSQRDAAEAEYQAMVAEMENGPDRADYMRLRERIAEEEASRGRDVVKMRGVDVSVPRGTFTDTSY